MLDKRLSALASCLFRVSGWEHYKKSRTPWILAALTCVYTENRETDALPRRKRFFFFFLPVVPSLDASSGVEEMRLAPKGSVNQNLSPFCVELPTAGTGRLGDPTGGASPCPLMWIQSPTHSDQAHVLGGTAHSSVTCWNCVVHDLVATQS